MPQWAFYLEPVWRFRDELGQFASQKQIWEYGNDSIQSTTDEVQEGALNLPVDEFETLMRRMIKLEVCKQYVLGIGGEDGLTQADYGAMGGIIADQYRYLDEMIAKYRAGEISSQRVAALSAMYINSTREAYERANGKVRGIPKLPAYPGSGADCLGYTNCKCRWEYHWRKGRWECYWTLGVADHCTLCLEHASEWSPLILSREGVAQ